MDKHLVVAINYENNIPIIEYMCFDKGCPMSINALLSLRHDFDSVYIIPIELIEDYILEHIVTDGERV